MTKMGQPALRGTNEVPFALEELFYSRTDTRGVIQSGNEIFRRTAGFEWSEMIGAPHKIVRHPDTPRAVFRVLWDALKKGYPMGAYVKNKAKGGGWYWVFAVVMPIEGGYLSVRLKPTSELSDEIHQLYRDLSARERAESLDPEESATLLRDFAERGGYSSYTAFMAYALALELTERDRRLNRNADENTRMLAELNTAMGRLTKEQFGLLRSFEALQSVPNNMRIVASRLEPSGGPVSAISENYKASSAVISERLRKFVAGRGNLCGQMAFQVARAVFQLGCARVLNEMSTNFMGEEAQNDQPREDERALLQSLVAKGTADANAAMRQAAELADDMMNQSRDIRRQLLGLDTIRVLGRVECGRMRDANGGLAATIDQLDSFHDDIKGRLEAILALSEEIEHWLGRYLRAGRSAA